MVPADKPHKRHVGAAVILKVLVKCGGGRSMAGGGALLGVDNQGKVTLCHC